MNPLEDFFAGVGFSARCRARETLPGAPGRLRGRANAIPLEWSRLSFRRPSRYPFKMRFEELDAALGKCGILIGEIRLHP